MMLIIIVVVFVVCHSIRSIVNSYEFIQYIMYGNLASWPDWIATLVHFRLVLLLRHIWFVMFQRIHRAVATSQKDVETHLNGGHNLPPRLL